MSNTIWFQRLLPGSAGAVAPISLRLCVLAILAHAANEVRLQSFDRTFAQATDRALTISRMFVAARGLHPHAVRRALALRAVLSPTISSVLGRV